MKDIIEERLNIDLSFDLGKKEIVINNNVYTFYYVSSLINQDGISILLQTIFDLNDIFKITNLQASRVYSIDEFITGILSGMLGICGNELIIIDFRNYPGREPSEPDTEKIVRGARDGFTENIIKNCGLLRRRIRTPQLINELYKIGYESKTDLCLTYIKNKVDLSLLEIIRNSLKEINSKEIVMADKAIEELIITNKWSAYPLVRYTERPDTLAIHLYQGKIGIIVDNSPVSIILPTTYFDHLEHAEEFRQRPLIGTILKNLRLFGVLISLFLMPIFMLSLINQNHFFNLELRKTSGILIQVLIAEVGIEFLRTASIHTPTPLSNAMGILAGVLIGEMAISIGLFTPEIVLFSAISQIASYITPSYELGLANKLSKIIFLILTYFFLTTGLIIGIILWIIYLYNLKSFTKRYLYPIIPFNKNDFLKIFIRFPHKK